MSASAKEVKEPLKIYVADNAKMPEFTISALVVARASGAGVASAR